VGADDQVEGALGAALKGDLDAVGGLSHSGDGVAEQVLGGVAAALVEPEPEASAGAPSMTTAQAADATDFMFMTKTPVSPE
jgi:hypothetical protein